MNEQTVDLAQAVVASDETPEFLKRVAEKLDQDGEVFIQTEETVGSEDTAPVAA